MAKRTGIKWGWLMAAAVAVAGTVLALGFRAGSCIEGDWGGSCTTIDATSPPIIGIVVLGIAATVLCCVKAFRR